MASELFNQDSNGKRITTDILVCGYIADVCKQYQLLIPDEIKRICFAYWITLIQMESKIEQMLGKEDQYNDNFWTHCDENGVDDDMIDVEIDEEKDEPGSSSLAGFYDEYGDQFPFKDSNISEDQKMMIVWKVIFKCHSEPDWDPEMESIRPKCRYCIQAFTNSIFIII